MQSNITRTESELMTKASGVYAIVHIASGKLYVGSAVNLAQRWREHRSHLARNVHHSSHLQNAWNKHGENAFAFVVVRFCPAADLISEEQRWIDEMDATGRHGYNSSPTAGSILGMKHTPETIAKMSATRRTPEHRASNAAARRGKKQTPEAIAKTAAANRGRKRTPETCAKIGAVHKGREWTPEHRANVAAAQRKRVAARKGQKLTPEHRANMAAAQIGRKLTPETRAKIAAAHVGKKLTPEHRTKIGAAQTGKKHSPEARANMKAAQLKRRAEAKAAKLARGSMVQGELFT